MRKEDPHRIERDFISLKEIQGGRLVRFPLRIALKRISYTRVFLDNHNTHKKNCTLSLIHQPTS